jgi:hypothetical protein
MALATLQTILETKRKALSFTVTPEVQRQIKTFFETMGQLKKNPNLVLIPFDELSSTEVVISDSACTLYAVLYKKDTATATFSKMTDHASASSDTAAEFVTKQAAIGDTFLSFPSGVALASGLVMQGNTTADGGTGSSSDGAKGFAIVGAA